MATLSDRKLHSLYKSAFYYDGLFDENLGLGANSSNYKGRIFHNRSSRGSMQLIEAQGVQYCDKSQIPNSREMAAAINGGRGMNSIIAFLDGRRDAHVLQFHFRLHGLRRGPAHGGLEFAEAIAPSSRMLDSTILLFVRRVPRIFYTDVYLWWPGQYRIDRLIDFISSENASYIVFRFKYFRRELTLFFNNTKHILSQFRGYY